MRYIDSTSIGAVSSMLKGSTTLPAGSGMYSLLFGAAGLRSMSKSKRKKMSRRRFRMFVDNIILHHRRLHNRNRQITIDLARSRILNKDKNREKAKAELARKKKNKWREKYAKHHRAVEIKERINARRIRAKSSWTALIDEKRSLEGNI